jgi:hypothetical protein
MTSMKSVHLVICLLLIATGFAGCSSIPAIPGGQGGPSGSGVMEGPVQTVPADYSVDIQVNQKDSIYKTVDVVFTGGKGQIQVSNILLKFTRSDGPVETKVLKPEKGATVTFQGTEGTDRVEVVVSYNNGTSYKVIDAPVPYRTRG